MTRRQFAVACLVCALLAIGSALMFQSARERRAMEIERTRMIQEERTTRTQERWDAIQRVPFLRKENPKHPKAAGGHE